MWEVLGLAVLSALIAAVAENFTFGVIATIILVASSAIYGHLLTLNQTAAVSLLLIQMLWNLVNSGFTYFVVVNNPMYQVDPKMALGGLIVCLVGLAMIRAAIK